MTNIELLAPVRSYELGVAAIDCGADALYVGGPSFGARVAATNSTDDIGRLAEYAHRFGAKVYVTMNTLLMDGELAAAERQAWKVWEAGADALIVQDMAFLRMDLPDIELHASTQAFNTDPQRVRFLQDVGFSRVILERALSIDDIKAIRAVSDVELEAFVHGAICVGYSGQCYLSRTLSERSGNRGSCSQPCRLPFNLLNGDMKPLIKDKHLLSLQDMNLGDRLGDMIDAGVTSFKIEGRLKDADYVKNVVGWYRQRLDKIIDSRKDLCRASDGVVALGFGPDPAKSFSRGGTLYFIDGVRRGVSSFATPKSTGEYLGEVESTGRDSFVLGCAHSVSNGDGICFLDPEDGLQGTNVNVAEPAGPGLWRIVPRRMGGIRPGTKVYRNFDREFSLAVDRARTRRSLPVRAFLEVSDSLARLSVSCRGVSASAEAEGRFDPARDEKKALEAIRSQLSKSGGTIFDVVSVEIVDAALKVGNGACPVVSGMRVPEPGDAMYGRDAGAVSDTGGAGRAVTSEAADRLSGSGPSGCMVAPVVRFIPVSVLNDLRRRALEALDAALTEYYRRRPVVCKEKPVVFPVADMHGDYNITNRLSASFYAGHGVDVASLPQSRELEPCLEGFEVMRTRYCLRRETGECLKENPRYRGKLYLEHGLHLYELEFHCRRCEMGLVYLGRREHTERGVK